MLLELDDAVAAHFSEIGHISDIPVNCGPIVKLATVNDNHVTTTNLKTHRLFGCFQLVDGSNLESIQFIA